MKTTKIFLIVFLIIGFTGTAASIQYFEDMANLMNGLSNDSTYLSNKITAFSSGNLSQYLLLQACRNKLERAKVRTKKVINAEPPAFFTSTHIRVVLTHTSFQIALEFMYDGIKNNDIERVNASTLILYHAQKLLNEVNAIIQPYTD